MLCRKVASHFRSLHGQPLEECEGRDTISPENRDGSEKPLKTRWIVGSSALVLGASGLLLTFASGEIAIALGASGDGLAPLSMQLLGAAQLGWAMTNWMSRESLFGGIYGRPLIVGNLLHFFAGGSALLKSALVSSSRAMLVVGVVYALLAVAFGSLLFRNPLPDSQGR